MWFSFRKSVEGSTQRRTDCCEVIIKYFYSLNSFFLIHLPNGGLEGSLPLVQLGPSRPCWLRKWQTGGGQQIVIRGYFNHAHKEEINQATECLRVPKTIRAGTAKIRPLGSGTVLKPRVWRLAAAWDFYRKRGKTQNITRDEFRHRWTGPGR